MNSICKVIFTGPVGAGKTTAISTICDRSIIKTEATTTDHIKSLKPNITVALDYCITILKGGRKVHLYGTPS